MDSLKPLVEMRTIAISSIIFVIISGCTPDKDNVQTADREAMNPVASPAKDKLYGGDYLIDDQHSYIGFRIRYFGTSNVRGRFDRFKGTAFYDSSSGFLSAQIIIDASSINTGVRMRDNDLKGGSWLAVEKFSHITFKSSAVAVGENGFAVTGELSFKNRKETITATFTKPIKITKDWAGNDQVDFTGEFAIKRSDFGIAADGRWNKIMENGFTQLADEVKIELEIHARRADHLRRKMMLAEIDSAANVIMDRITQDGFQAGVKFINDLHSADKKRPDEFTLYTIGGILFAEKKYDDALEIIEMRSSFYPEVNDGLNLLAICYLLKGDIGQARRKFNQAVHRDSTNTRALEYLRLLQ